MPLGKLFSALSLDDSKKNIQPYQYEPLHDDKQFIRVIEIQKKRKNNLECVIRQIRISEGGYLALSYEWGSSVTPYSLLVRDEHDKQLSSLPITANLRDALQDLRDAPTLEPDVRPKDFWYDRLDALFKLNDDMNEQIRSVQEANRYARRFPTRRDGSIDHSDDLDKKIWKREHPYTDYPVKSTTENTRAWWSAIRQKEPLPKIRRFWIDQISINQSDKLEKGHQIQLMGEIYKNALQVITYLGPESTEVNEMPSLHFLRRLHHHFKPNYDTFSRHDNLWAIYLDKESLPVGEFPEELAPFAPHFPTLIKVVFGAWIRRLWMLQENLLCSSTIMLRGRTAFSWFAVAAIPILFHLEILPLDILKKEWPKMGFKSDAASVAQAIVQMWGVRIALESGQPVFDSLSLTQNLMMFEDFECFLPRDRIYALLAISADTKELGIVPNYEKPENEVFVDFTIAAYLKYPESSYLLDSVGSLDPITDDSRPTWSFRPGKGTVSPFRNPSSPHPTPSRTVQFESNNSTMVIRGRVLDTIELVTKRIPWFNKTIELPLKEDDMADFLKEIFINLITVLEFQDVDLKTTASLFCAFSDYQAPVRSRDEDLSYRFRESFKEAIVELKTYYGSKGEAEYATFFTRADKILEAWDHVLGDLKDTNENEASDPPITIGHAFGVTQHKRICNLPGSTEVGDVVAAFPAGESLYILRPVKSREDVYRYIGTVYADGLMNGEAYEGVSPEEVDKEIRLI
jgi:hypothetical protein